MRDIGAIRPVRDDEIELMRRWRNAPSVRMNMYTRHEISHEEHCAWWSRIKQDESNQYLMYQMDGSPLGIVGFNGVDRINKQSLWAFYAAPDAPRGTGTNMEFLALDYAFTFLELHKLSCEVLAFNAPVIKLHEKFGFKIEGVFREHHRVDENYVDVVRLGMLSAEWGEQRPNMKAKIEKLAR